MTCHLPAASVSSSRRHPSLSLQSAPSDLTVDQTIELYLDSLHSRGVSESSLITAANQLRRFFGPALAEPLNCLTPLRAKQFSDILAEQASPRTGRMLALTTCVSTVATARRFCAWCLEQGRMTSDPMAAADVGALMELQRSVTGLRKALADMTQLRDDALAKLRMAGGAP